MKRVCLSLLVALIFALSSGAISSFAAEGSHVDMDGSHMEAGKADHVWSLEEIAGLAE